jgi:hypothetical protein
VDLSEVEGRHFLVIVDQFSGWPAVTMFADKNTTARRLINAFRAFFMDTGGGAVKTTSMLTITLCNSSEGGSVGKKWFAQASKIVPGSELRAPLMERLCGSEMDFDLQVKDSRALNESPVVALAQKVAHDLQFAARRARW